MPHPSPPHAGQSKLHLKSNADLGVHVPSRWSMRRPFVTFSILVPVGLSARDEVASKAIMSLLMRAIAVPACSQVLDAVFSLSAFFASAFCVWSPAFWLCALSILRFEAPQSLQRLPTLTDAL